MGRPLRVQYPGAFYHITSRGNERKAIFSSKRDREQFLSYLESASERYGAVIHVFCLMSNHYHLLLETPHSNLSQIMHHINGAYTNYFNKKRRRSGHLFQGRYKAILVEKDAYCQELSRYIHLNPVRAKLVEDPLEYPWSSYPYYVGAKERPDWLKTDDILGYFAKGRSKARRLYKQFVESGIGKEVDNPFEKVFAYTFLAGDDFICWVREKWINFKEADRRNIPALKEIIRKPSLDEIEQAVESVIKRDDPLYKKVAIYCSHQFSGASLKEIGTHFSMRDSAVSQSSRRFKVRISEDKELQKIVEKIKRHIGNVKC